MFGITLRPALSRGPLGVGRPNLGVHHRLGAGELDFASLFTTVFNQGVTFGEKWLESDLITEPAAAEAAKAAAERARIAAQATANAAIIASQSGKILGMEPGTAAIVGLVAVGGIVGLIVALG